MWQQDMRSSCGAMCLESSPLEDVSHPLTNFAFALEAPAQVETSFVTFMQHTHGIVVAGLNALALTCACS